MVARFAVLLILAPIPTGALDFLSVMPGMARAELVAALERDGIEPVFERFDRIVVEEPLLEAVFERQTAVFLFENGRLQAAHLVVTPDRDSMGEDVLRLSDEIERITARALGRPAWRRREGGAPGHSLLQAISVGEVVRVAQWEEKERTIRTGIPRRLDGSIGPEIVITRQRIPKGREMWGADPRR
ncbi:MAG TPA: hypothetical protein VM557_00725 [Thermoanaerobaculia bacterium]|nr:hypothetical protein [Thermoanaerobaculia bacterium]